METKVPFVDLKAQYQRISKDVDAAVQRVLGRCDFILGDEVNRFEEEFAKYLGVKKCIGVGSGTDALDIALRAAGVGPGDEVIVPANTFVATALAVVRAGARPVLADMVDDNYTISVADAESRVTPRTKAIIPVHLYGRPADMDAILDLAHRRGLIVIEDACQAHGALCKGRRCGSIGLAGAFSFYPGKNLGAYGDGGLIATSDERLAERACMLRNYGQRVKYQHLEKGWNSRLDTIQAAVLRAKLPYLDEWCRARAKHAEAYAERLRRLEQVAVPLFDTADDLSHVFHLYVIRASRRDELMRHLAARGIVCGIHYPTPIHMQPAFSDLGYREGDFPVTEKAAREILSLPMFAELRDDQIDYVCSEIEAFYASQS